MGGKISLYLSFRCLLDVSLEVIGNDIGYIYCYVAGVECQGI